MEKLYYLELPLPLQQDDTIVNLSLERGKVFLSNKIQTPSFITEFKMEDIESNPKLSPFKIFAKEVSC